MAGDDMDKRLDQAFEAVKRKYDIDIHLRDHQINGIRNVINRNDVFTLLPTGYGKSMTFISTPLLLDELEKTVHHTALVISHLKALMADQVEQLHKRGVKSVALMENTKIQDLETSLSVIFASPESVNLLKWKKVLRGKFKTQICLLVFDEAHCISSWGLDFRPSYRQVSILQSFFDVPNLILTATATQKIQEDLYAILGLGDNTEVVAALPNRPNIFMSLVNCSENFEIELSWILSHLQKDRKEGKKMILYVRSINLCYRIYLWLMTELMEKDTGGEVVGRVEMYHANTDSVTKDKIMKEFVQENDKIQLLISTVAFGMGVNIPDIDIVIHWGIPNLTLNYWQEIGRCARDGRLGCAAYY